MSNKNKPAKNQIVPLRVPGELAGKIRTISKKAGLSDAAVMRLAMERGLDRVEAMFEPAAKAAA